MIEAKIKIIENVFWFFLLWVEGGICLSEIVAFKTTVKESNFHYYKNIVNNYIE